MVCSLPLTRKGEGNVDWFSGRDRSGVCLCWLADCQRSVRRTARTPAFDAERRLTSAGFNQMKKPKLHPEEQPQPRNIQRADIAPSDGYTLVVDGHFKTQFAEEEAAKKAAAELLAKYPMLQVEIYDASSKSRTLVK